MGRLIRYMILLAIGAGLAYVFDPVSGRKRRADLIAQARSQLSQAADTVDAKARYQRGKAKGWIYETFVPEEPPGDERELMQKIRSEAVGPTRGEVDHVDIRVEEDGIVHLVGTSIDRAVEDELARRISEVTGVTEVRNELVPSP